MQVDEALYRDIRKGSSAAFELLYAKYERPLFSFLMRRLANRQEAEEIFHETMISIYRGPDSFSGQGSFSAYLYKVALNLSLNRSRSRKREEKALAKVFPFESERLATVGSEEELLEKEDVAVQLDQESRLKSSVEDLSPSLRQVYDLRKEGKSYEEMSVIVGVPVGTIKSRIHKMMSELRKEVGRWIAK